MAWSACAGNVKMQPYNITLAFVLLLITSSVNAVALNTRGGVVEMSGQIVESACTIAADDFYQNITFGEHAVQSLLEKNQRYSVTLRLQNCRSSERDATEQPVMLIAMTGETVGESNDIFATTGTGSGVGIQFFQDSHSPYRAGEYMPAALNSSGDALDLSLRLVHDGEPIRYGDYHSSLKFTIDYP